MLQLSREATIESLECELDRMNGMIDIAMESIAQSCILAVAIKMINPSAKLNLSRPPDRRLSLAFSIIRSRLAGNGSPVQVYPLPSIDFPSNTPASTKKLYVSGFSMMRQTADDDSSERTQDSIIDI